MLRTVAAWLALPALAVPFAGCGNSSGAFIGSTRTSITRAQVVAYARNVNLRAADAPGMTARSVEREVNAAAREAELGRCIGIPTRRRDVVRIASPSLRRQAFRAISSVAADLNDRANPASLAAEDTRDIAAAVSQHGVACQERYFQREYTRPGVSRVEVATLPNPLSGIYGGVGFRFRVTVAGTHVGEVMVGTPKTRKPIPVVVYADVFLLAVGSAGIELEADGIAEPFPQETERRLISLLYRRAEAHKL